MSGMRCSLFTTRASTTCRSAAHTATRRRNSCARAGRHSTTRAHELRRRIPQHPGAPRVPGTRGAPGCCGMRRRNSCARVVEWRPARAHEFRRRVAVCAADLHVVEALVVNKEQRIPDIAYFRTGPDPVSTGRFLLMHGQEYHTSYWGHIAFLGLTDHYILPEYAGYPNTAAASLSPTNADVADLAHAQGALVGYVHPFETPPDPADTTEPLTHELPADVALGKVDYVEVMGYSDHLVTSRVWYRLLNCGFRLPAGAGTDAFPNFASLRGPPGLVRVYVKTG